MLHTSQFYDSFILTLKEQLHKNIALQNVSFLTGLFLTIIPYDVIYKFIYFHFFWYSAK